MLFRPLSWLYSGYRWGRCISSPLWLVDLSCAKDSLYFMCIQNRALFSTRLSSAGAQSHKPGTCVSRVSTLRLQPSCWRWALVLWPCVTRFMLLQLSSPPCPFWCNGCSCQHSRGVHAVVRMGKAAVFSGITSVSIKRRETYFMKVGFITFITS